MKQFFFPLFFLFSFFCGGGRIYSQRIILQRILIVRKNKDIRCPPVFINNGRASKLFDNRTIKGYRGEEIPFEFVPLCDSFSYSFVNDVSQWIKYLEPRANLVYFQRRSLLLFPPFGIPLRLLRGGVKIK